MKNIFFTFACSCLVGVGFAEEDFVPLFNGHDLSGWINVNCAPETWRATNGMIFCTGVPTGELRTTRMYQNFILELEWRHLKPKGNSGVFVWADALTARGQPFIRALEVQVLDGLETAWYTSDGDIFPIHGAKMIPENGRGGDRAYPTEKREKPSPEWNHYRVECIDGAISLEMNGKVVTRGHDASPRKGYICLESEGSPIEFRNLRLKELPAKEALAPENIAVSDEGFRPLYTGVDLSGWQVTPELKKHWLVKNWTLEHDGERELTDKTGHLWTEKEYGDFVLVADWRWTSKPKTNAFPVILPDGSRAKNEDGSAKMVEAPDAGDSGIFLRGYHDAQVNIWCSPIGSGDLYNYRENADAPAELRAAAMPKIKADMPIGEWNRFVITMRGNRVTVVLNGKTVIDNVRLPGVPAKGRIGLQHHSDPIQFANLFVRELD
jgi:hypothetical protein